MRYDDQTFELFLAVVGERKYRPIGAAFARAHLDPEHDPVRTGGGRYLNLVGIGMLAIDDVGQIDRRRLGPHVHGVDRAGARSADNDDAERRHQDGRAEAIQPTPSKLDGLWSIFRRSEPGLP